MSWHPTIWIKQKDFGVLLRRYSGTFFSHDFTIAGEKGVALYGSTETSSPNHDLHAFLLGAGIEHWIINGEGAECNECHTYGKEVRHGND